MSVLSLAQGVYYAVTGFWPLVNIRSFQAVTGPKVDLWLVQAMGLLIGVIGVVLIVAGARGKNSTEIDLLAAGSAASLGAIDLTYGGRRISSIYLLEGAVEVAFVLARLFARAARIMQKSG